MTERDVPERAVPERAAPGPAVPERAVPESAVPERAVPESAVPERAVPERSGTRDRERTRRAILDAASRMFADEGNAGSLADIAAAAGVSKSGLLHHFPSRDALILAVADDRLRGFRDEVLGSVDLSENRPGKLHRAYVRALAGDAPAVTTLFAFSGFWGTVDRVPGNAERFAEDEERWRRDFAADGLPRERALVVRYAAEGMAEAKALSAIGAEDLRMLRAALLDLTEGDDRAGVAPRA